MQFGDYGSGLSLAAEGWHPASEDNAAVHIGQRHRRNLIFSQFPLLIVG